MRMRDFKAPACPKCRSKFVKDVQIEPQALRKVQKRAVRDFTANVLTGGLYSLTKAVADPFDMIGRNRARMLVKHTLWKCNQCEHQWVGTG